ncbi:MAG: UbiD family decarboxylase [Rhodospirillaceae bacterium]|jgi:2,5-furandicarboxylate decarboxylase 1|nr:UbiD family decarboxylase [Rhodospirillaceae bacterium]MBT5458590.1 UbiD family decarboxylase [Rhodospirillaceae bacterium]
MAHRDFRDFLNDLESGGHLRKISKPVDPRDMSALGEQIPEATLFENIEGYPDWRVATALVSTRARLAVAMGCTENRIAFEFEERATKPIDPVVVEDAPCQEVVLEGDDVDLTSLPLPLMHLFDGGAYISGTFAVSEDPEHGPNVGCYRLMYRSPKETGIDLVSPSDMRFYYQRALDEGKPLPIAIAVGVHPLDMLAASYKAPIDSSELALAGALRGEALRMVKCKTLDLKVPADAELVLEGELLPVGWTADEGPFGEFSQISGDVKWNPIFRVKCITHRRNPIFYMLQMPWENDWLAAPVTEAAGLQALRIASVQPVDIRAPVGSCGYWSLIASIRKRPGEGKNAVAALLSVAEVKHVIVTDDDINIHDPDDIDWAIAFRVQADEDTVIIRGARAKHIDPSVKSWELGKGGLPTTAKLGIDATIPEGVPKILYRRIKNYRRDKVRLEDYE